MTMTIDQFRADARTMSVAQYEAEHGEGIVSGILPLVETLRVYPHGAWIAQMGERVTGTDEHNWYLRVEDKEYSTFRNGQTLAEMEEVLLDWVNDQQRFGGSTTVDRLDALAVAMMATRPDLAQMSLDEWLATHHDQLTREERAAARAILDLHEVRS